MPRVRKGVWKHAQRRYYNDIARTAKEMFGEESAECNCAISALQYCLQSAEDEDTPILPWDSLYIKSVRGHLLQDPSFFRLSAFFFWIVDSDWALSPDTRVAVLELFFDHYCHDPMLVLRVMTIDQHGLTQGGAMDQAMMELYEEVREEAGDFVLELVKEDENVQVAWKGFKNQPGFGRALTEFNQPVVPISLKPSDISPSSAVTSDPKRSDHISLNLTAYGAAMSDPYAKATASMVLDDDFSDVSTYEGSQDGTEKGAHLEETAGGAGVEDDSEHKRIAVLSGPSTLRYPVPSSSSALTPAWEKRSRDVATANGTVFGEKGSHVAGSIRGSVKKGHPHVPNKFSYREEKSVPSAAEDTLAQLSEKADICEKQGRAMTEVWMAASRL